MTRDPFHKTITSEQLERDRVKRDKERADTANEFEAAAGVLHREVPGLYPKAERLLRDEAKRWRL